MTDKGALRKEFLSRRKQLSPDVLTTQSLLIKKQFEDFFNKNPKKSVHVFLPIERQSEIDTWPIIKFLWEAEVSVIVSRSHFMDHSMTHYRLEPTTELAENEWGIPEPVNAQKIPVHEIEMVILPLVIFDLQGYRIGYGKGFYDKFLSQAPTHVLKVGVSLFPPVELLKNDDHDVRMDFCITPELTYQF